ncbi:MAG: ATP-dependent Clp protease proteolytic subunit [Nanoarchaeota archaeon]
MKNEKRDFQLFAKDKGISSLTLDKYSKIINNSVFTPVSIAKTPFAMTPNIIEERQMNAVAMDVFSRLMMDRIIFLGMGIDDMVANVVNAQLLYLESIDAKKDITIYINSPGGGVYSGLGIYDVMQYVSPNIVTVNTGICASMAYVLACAGTKGKRFSLPHARFMQHQPLGGASGQASDIEITAREINKLKKELYEIIALHTGKNYETIEKDCDRDFWMTAKEAKDYGCIDQVLSRPKGTK